MQGQAPAPMQLLKFQVDRDRWLKSNGCLTSDMRSMACQICMHCTQKGLESTSCGLSTVGSKDRVFQHRRIVGTLAFAPASLQHGVMRPASCHMPRSAKGHGRFFLPEEVLVLVIDIHKADVS